MRFIHNNKVELHSETALQLRKIISEWANTIPHHGWDSFGENLNITNITYCPSYEIKLQTQYYKERIYESKIPYKGEKLNIQQRIVDTQIPFGQFINNNFNYIIPGSEKLRNCSNCSGKGTNKCNACNGGGEVTCGTCNGAGKNKCNYCDFNGEQKCGFCDGDGRVKCPNCYGDRYKDENVSRTQWDYKTKTNITVSGRVRKWCNNCSKTGKVRCRSFFCNYGKVRCSYCSGSAYHTCRPCDSTGKQNCRKCKGKGRVVCNYCNGSKKEVYFNGKTRDWYYKNIKTNTINTIYNNSLYSNFKLLPKFSRKTIYTKPFKNLDFSFTDAEPDYFKQSFKKMIVKSREGINKNVSRYPQILHQNLAVAIISIYHISYTFENEKYTMLVLDQDKTVYEEFGPIENKRLYLKSEGLRKIKRKNYGEGKNLLNMSYNMDPDDFDEDLIKLIIKADFKIKSSYRTGAFIGSLIWAYIFSLLFVAYIYDINQALNDISPNHAKQNLILVGASFFSITLFLHHVFNKYRLAEWLFRKYDNRMSPELLRMTMGAVSSLPPLIFSSIITILVSQIGATELVAKIIWLIYDTGLKLLESIM